MKKRVLGKTGFPVSEISLGTWQLGAKWGEPFNAKVAQETLEAAASVGINCFDTADIYQNGDSERAIASFCQNTDEPFFIITKVGRKLNPHTAEGYNAENIRAYIEDSRRNLQTDSLDLVLLHCPPTEVYTNDALFQALEEMKIEGLIKHYGVSVETVDEAMMALKYDIAAIEIIFNMFRLKPTEKFFQAAKEKNVGIIVRVPLASGLLSGRYKIDQQFSTQDHRNFNREGKFFDKGETFSGVDYKTGLEAVEELKQVFHTDNLAPYALKYILEHDAVSTVIPGASNPLQIQANAAASQLADFSKDQMDAVKAIYDQRIKPLVHHLW